MKVERINENQIRVIMSSQDLLDRNITLSEVAYGSEKGQALFEEVMAQARELCDFTFDENYPLIIEAIPMSKTELTIIISKISVIPDPDKGFSFLPQTKTERKFIQKSADDAPLKPVYNENSVAIFIFKNLDDVTSASLRLCEFYNGINMLYKLNKKYYLILHPDTSGGERAFGTVESILLDYGRRYSLTPIAKMYVLEHGELIANQAVQNFSKYL